MARKHARAVALTWRLTMLKFLIALINHIRELESKSPGQGIKRVRTLVEWSKDKKEGKNEFAKFISDFCKASEDPLPNAFVQGTILNLISA